MSFFVSFFSINNSCRNNIVHYWEHGHQIRENRSSLARVPVINSWTLFTSHVTAPYKLALAPFHLSHHLSIVSSPAAQQIAPVTSSGGLIAHSSRRAWNSQRRIRIAVVWWTVDVHQGVFCYLDAFLFLPPYSSFFSVVHNLHGFFVLGFQVISNFGEVWHSFPASLDGTGARNSMATTLITYKTLNNL